MTYGHKTLVDAVFNDLGLNDFLNGLKRSQGNSVAAETVALVANCVEMTGISVNRLDRLLRNDTIRAEYGLVANAPRSIYRTVERLGEKSDDIVRFLTGTLRRKYGIGMDTVFMDWTSMYFEAPQNGIVRVGYSRDHRPDRPQVTVGLCMDSDSGMPVGLTLNPGNVLDVTHFSDSFDQIRAFLPKDATVVFDNGAYSKNNSAMMDEAGVAYVTRLQLNRSDDRFVSEHPENWIRIDDDISYQVLKGNNGHCRYVFRSNVRRTFILKTYHKKAERDWDEMQVIRKGIDKGRKPRKKYRNANCFVDTRLSYQFPLDGRTREEAIDEAVGRMTSGREGIFVLVANRPFSAAHTLELYRSRGRIENAFRDLKHGIDWRPARCTSEKAIRGRVLISFLALFCMSMVRYLYPAYRNVTAESISEELGSFSLTVIGDENGEKRRYFSNFGPLMRLLGGHERPERVPKAPDQAVLDRF